MPDKAIGFSAKGITQSRLKVWLPVTLISHLFFNFLSSVLSIIVLVRFRFFFFGLFLLDLYFFCSPLKFELIYVLLIIVFGLDLVFIRQFFC